MNWPNPSHLSASPPPLPPFGSPSYAKLVSERTGTMFQPLQLLLAVVDFWAMWGENHGKDQNWRGIIAKIEQMERNGSLLLSLQSLPTSGKN
jgi:hypothetical protein